MDLGRGHRFGAARRHFAGVTSAKPAGRAASFPQVERTYFDHRGNFVVGEEVEGRHDIVERLAGDFDRPLQAVERHDGRKVGRQEQVRVAGKRRKLTRLALAVGLVTGDAGVVEDLGAIDRGGDLRAADGGAGGFGPR